MDFIRIHPTVSYSKCGRDHAPARHWIDFFMSVFLLLVFCLAHTKDGKAGLGIFILMGLSGGLPFALNIMQSRWFQDQCYAYYG